MPKEDWGTKRVCPTTGKRFYDMGRSPIVSPYTGEVVIIETGRGGRVTVAEKVAKKPKAAEPAEDDAVLVDDDDTAEVDLGDEVLEDDDEEEDVSLDDLADVPADDDDG